MEIIADTLDDLLYKTYQELLSLQFKNEAKRTKGNGPFSELFGVLLELKNPRARLSLSDERGKLFSSIGELLWYFSRTDDLSFIEYYIQAYIKESEDKKTVYGGYGPRLFNSSGQYNQIENVINLLEKNPTSKKAVVQLFEPRDIEYELTGKKASIPCTCSLHFLQREKKLHMMTQMRSNDAYLGLPHDIFAFTMIQEYIATRLNYELGVYKHSVASLHLYENSRDLVQDYMKEGLQSTKKYMRPMPAGDQTTAINKVLEIEQKLRLNEEIAIEGHNLDPYWLDIVYLLMFFKENKKSKDRTKMEYLRGLIAEESYTHILDRRIQKVKK